MLSFIPKMKSRQPITCLSFSSCIATFLVSSLFIFLATAITSHSYSGNDTDHLALLKFKSVITNDPYGALTSWNESSHFCTWYGVSCGKRHRRVTALVLESQGLKGSLSPHVGNLSFLRVLSLSNNSIQGTIPHELGRLSRLRSLVLELNRFEGTIPTNLSSFNLEELFLENNKLVGSIPKEISCFLPKLTILSVGDNTLTGGIPPFLGNITSLEVFSAPDNPLDGSIPDTFGRLKSFTEFDCGTCKLHGSIPRSIFNHSLLNILSLPNNTLSGSLPLEIGAGLPNLVILQLNNNKLTGNLPPSISNCSKLRLLETNDNNFSGKVTIDFSKLTDINGIFLFNNNLHGRGEADDMKFIDSLKNCSNLLTLHLSHCSLHGMLPKSIGNLSDQLDSLYLRGNQLHGNVPSSVGKLVGLTRLYLDSNQFKGRIPTSIGMLQNLGYVDLYGNKFSGPIPDAIGNLSLLIIADLSSNRLNGRIPSSLGNCRNLIVLDLDDNELSGNIPKQLLQLPSLTILLNLSQNQLSGPLPTEVGDLQMLSQLDLSYNNLSGNIPSRIGGCASLTFLSIRANVFQGVIPRSLRSLRGLEVLDISQNNLSGKIPQFLEQVSFDFMNLSFNDFDGEVPVLGVFANSSAFSVLGNDRLCDGLVELGLPKCNEIKRHKKRFPMFIIAILAAPTLFAILCIIFAWRKKKSNGHPPQSSRSEKFLQVSYNQLLKATDGFSRANLIGEGGFSSVYKGILEFDDDIVVAVKVLHLQNRGAQRSFMRECEAWRCIRHRNLLKIITACSSIDFHGNDFKALVYEFMPNGSLEDWLHSSKSARLTLLQRINILIDVATALDYLHNQCVATIVHGDVKPSNILLDDDMLAHVGDFGLARFLGTELNQNSSTGIRGTIGYAPPEYGLGNAMTSSGDVYSFGILLLEVMTGKKPTDNVFNEGLSLHEFSFIALPDHVTDVIDSDAIVLQSTEANAQKMEECLASTLKIGVSCSVDSPSQRMNIENVVHQLRHILDVLQNIEVFMNTWSYTLSGLAQGYTIERNSSKKQYK